MKGGPDRPNPPRSAARPPLPPRDQAGGPGFDVGAAARAPRAREPPGGRLERVAAGLPASADPPRGAEEAGRRAQGPSPACDCPRRPRPCGGALPPPPVATRSLGQAEELWYPGMAPSRALAHAVPSTWNTLPIFFFPPEPGSRLSLRARPETAPSPRSQVSSLVPAATTPRPTFSRNLVPTRPLAMSSRKAYLPTPAPGLDSWVPALQTGRMPSTIAVTKRAAFGASQSQGAAERIPGS